METITARRLRAARNALASLRRPMVGLAVLSLPANTSVARAGASEPAQPATLTDHVAGVAAWLSHYASAAFEHTPALALVVATAVLSLLLVLTGVLIRFATGLRAGATAEVVAGPAAGDRTGFARPRRVWLEAGAPGASHYAISSEVTRIGREPDNDIRLETPGTDRYHASITRTPELDHYLVALTAEGRGLSVNGETTTRRRLRDGDIIDIAGVALRFRAAPL